MKLAYRYFRSALSALCLAVSVGVISALTVAPAAAGPDRLSFLIGSHHVNSSQDFNEINPGVFVTWENPNLHWTVGVYHNSYKRVSVSATVAVPVIRWDHGEASIFAGAALYPKDGRTFSVHVGDVVPLAGVQVRHKNMFAQLIPLDGNIADAIISVGLTIPIK